LTEADFENWLTDDHYDKAINGMYENAESFIDTTEYSSIVNEVEQYKIISHAKFGWHDKNGHVKNVFNMNLSGVELRLTLPILREKECN